MIHIKTFNASGDATVIDMDLAHKRGKHCRRFRAIGAARNCDTDADRNATGAMLAAADTLTPEATYDDAVAAIRAAAAGYSATLISFFEDTIRAVDAPLPRLTAGIDGVWSARADDTGIHLADLTDPANEPRAITHNQSNRAAYACAAKCWPKVQAAKTMYEAARILTAAGCRLHSYCAMD